MQLNGVFYCFVVIYSGKFSFEYCYFASKMYNCFMIENSSTLEGKALNI